MRRRATILTTGVVMAAMLVLAPPAAAADQWVCVGTASTAVVCVDPTGGVLFDDCVYAGPPPCTQVTVPGPIWACGGILSCW